MMANLQQPQAAPSATPAQAPSPAAAASHETGQPGSPVQYPPANFGDLLHLFDYDSKSGLELRETNFEKRGNIMMIELNYAGASGDRVPGYLLVPHGNGPFPAIVWGHWLMKGSPLANKDEFLDEALVLAHAGVMSLLIDAPQARHGYVAEKDILASGKQQSESAMHQVIDLRRGVDLLRIRRDVDGKRIAYVGHSWDAHVGAILAGVETRLCCFVLMASGYSDQADTFASQNPEIVRIRKQLGDDALREYFHDYAYDDPVNFVGHTQDESIFLQFASGDGITRERAQKYLDSFASKDKQMQLYDAPHALNAAARLDRVRWLQKHLGFKKLDEKELAAIPQLK
jgi:dienelactone hydrolase